MFGHPRTIRTIFVIFAILSSIWSISLANANSPTTVSGVITSNTTWIASNSPYIVTGNILVASGVSLTIEPGVTVQFAGGTTLQVNGTFVARGTSSSGITFTSNQPGPTPGDWGNLFFADSSVDATYDTEGNYAGGSILEYCTVTYGGSTGSAMVSIDRSAPLIDHCTITRSKSNGVYVAQGGAKITNSVISDNAGTGIQINNYPAGVGPNVTVSHSTISGNSGDGIYAYFYSGANAGVFTYNSVNNNGGSGLRFSSGNDVTISNSTIDANHASGINLDGGGCTGTRTYENMIVRNGAPGISLFPGWCGLTNSIYNNVIADNQGGLVIGGGGSNPIKIQNNTIARNASLGTSAVDWTGASSTDEFLRNTVAGNTVTSSPKVALHIGGTPKLNYNNAHNPDTTYELYGETSSAGPNWDARYNWWGTPNDSTIQSRIYDWNDDGSKAIVDYVPFLTAPDTTTPVMPPVGVTVSTSMNGTPVLNWSSNLESDLAGYKLYYDLDPGYPYANSIDVGHVTSTPLSGLTPAVYYVAVTAYDTDADGAHDWTDGNESWFSSEVIVDLSPPSVQFGQAGYTAVEAAGQLVLSVTLSKPSSSPVSAQYATSDGTAAAGEDYTTTGGTLTFAPGETTKSIAVPILNSGVYEADETFAVTLSNPSGATLGTPASATVTIVDDDPAPVVQFNTGTYNAGESAGTVVLPVSLNTASGVQTVVAYTTSDGTAAAGEDYTATGGTLTFAPGETTKSIAVPILNSGVYEADETFTVTLSNPNGATLGTPASATVTIVDDDPAPVVQFNTGTYNAGESAGTVVLPVSLNSASGVQTVVAYTTSDGTAAAGEDYTTTGGTLTFAPGETTKSITVPILNSGVYEADETFAVTLSNPNGATLGTPASATVTIVDDDPAPVTVEKPGDPSVPVEVAIPTPLGTVYLTLNGVQTGGVLTLSLSSDLPAAPPADFTLLSVYYGMNAPAVTFEQATVSIPYPEGTPQAVQQREADAGRYTATAAVPEQSLRLLYYSNGKWKDITAGLDTHANRITGVAESLSTFVVGWQNLATCAVSINSGATFTSRPQVTVFSNTEGAREILLANDAGFTGAQWQPYSTAQNWTLSDPGQRIVTLLTYVRLRDANRGVLCSGLTLSDDIIYDPLPPEVTVAADNVLAAADQQGPLATIPITILAHDQQGGSGVAEMQIVKTPSFQYAPWQPYQSNIRISATGSTTVYVRVRDGAGNLSATASVSVIGQERLLLPFIKR